jgi:histidine triad (HIT) family protein
MTDCIFCRIQAGDLPSSRMAQEEKVVAFLDIQPVNPGHTLVIPRRHAPFLSGVTPDEMRDMAALGQRIAAAQRQALSCDGVNFFLADGEVAGQEVSHAHLHVFPRHGGDGFGLRFPQSYRIEARDRLDETAERLRDALPTINSIQIPFDEGVLPRGSRRCQQ